MTKSLFAIAESYVRELNKVAKDPEFIDMDHKPSKKHDDNPYYQKKPRNPHKPTDNKNKINHEMYDDMKEDLYGFYDPDKDVPHPVKHLTPNNKKKVDAYVNYLLKKQANSLDEYPLEDVDDDFDDFDDDELYDLEHAKNMNPDLDADPEYKKYLNSDKKGIPLSEYDFDTDDDDLFEDDEDDIELTASVKQAKLSKDHYEPEFGTFEDFDSKKSRHMNFGKPEHTALDFDDDDESFDMDAFDVDDDSDPELPEFDPETDDDILDLEDDGLDLDEDLDDEDSDLDL